MGEKASPTYLSQLKAMIIRNLLLKKREKRKTIAVSTDWFVFLETADLGTKVRGYKTNSCCLLHRRLQNFSEVLIIISSSFILKWLGIICIIG
jgi:hypothetical protein